VISTFISPPPSSFPKEIGSCRRELETDSDRAEIFGVDMWLHLGDCIELGPLRLRDEEGMRPFAELDVAPVRDQFVPSSRWVLAETIALRQAWHIICDGKYAAVGWLLHGTLLPCSLSVDGLFGSKYEFLTALLNLPAE
jgi:hypothetical protein